MTPSLRLLHIENDGADAELIASLLREEWPTADIVRTDSRPHCTEALTAGTFDVILSDYRLPTFDGFWALVQAQQRCPDVPFIFVSGTLGEELAIETLQRGATDYVLKDRLTRLVPAVRRALTAAEERRLRKLAEDELQYAMAELRASEERYRLAARATNDAIWDVDLSIGRVAYNEVFERWFGAMPEDLEAARQMWRQRVHPEDRERVVMSFHEALAGAADHWRAEYRYQRTDGSYAEVMDRAFISRDDEGRATRLVGAVLDLTDRKRGEEEIKGLLREAESREQELRMTQTQLVQSAKLASLGELATGIAHELNNPLNNISLLIGNVIDALAAGCGEANRLVEELRLADQQVKRAATIITHMRTFGRMAPPAHQLLSINDRIRGALSLVQEPMRLGTITVRLDLDPAIPMVRGNATQLEQVFINLLMNAYDAMLESRRKELTVTTRGTASGVGITVKDTGCGIPAALLDRVFDPFFTTKPVGKDTGLGLSVSYGIIKDHHGTLTLESEHGVGTRFDIELPSADAPHGTD